jgi:L-iditol 2-dehydrogenase
MEPAACVLRGIERSGLTDEGVAVVTGGGSMGLLHLLVLRAMWPGVAVVVVDLDAGRLSLAARLGAARVARAGPEADAAVRELSNGLGADALFDTVGGAGVLDSAIALTRPGGTVVLFAHAPEGERSALDLNALFKSERRIVATYSGGLAEQERVFELICSGRLDASPLVTHRMPLDDFSEGVDLVVARKALKVLFTPSRGSGA